MPDRANLPGCQGGAVADPQTREQRFGGLTAEVGEPVRRYLVRRLSPDEVEDTLAEVFVVLWRRLDDVPPERPLPWAYGVARRCAANARRTRRRHLELIEKVTRLDPPREYTDPDLAPGAAGEEVRAALSRLSDLDRELVTLWAWEQLPPREIAAVLDLTPNAVSIRLTRAKQRLREALRKDPSPPGHRPDEGSTR